MRKEKLSQRVSARLYEIIVDEGLYPPGSKLPNELDPFDNEAFNQNPMLFWIVCTDVETGRPVYHRLTHGDGNEMHWIRASASMPLKIRWIQSCWRSCVKSDRRNTIALWKRRILITASGGWKSAATAKT